jgi:hypothetical protein
MRERAGLGQGGGGGERGRMAGGWTRGKGRRRWKARARMEAGGANIDAAVFYCFAEHQSQVQSNENGDVLDFSFSFVKFGTAKFKFLSFC